MVEEKRLEKIDLNDDFIEEIIDKLVKKFSKYDLKDLKNMDKNNEEFCILEALAIKIAISKKLTKQFDELLKKENKKINIFVVFAVYNENVRIKSKEEDPNGEDFLRKKWKQLNNLYKGSNFNPYVIIVDDSCPNKSGKLAEEIVKKEKYENIKVYYLEDYLGKGVLKRIKNGKESKKGGAILLGIEKSSQIGNKEDIIIYTDADLSINLEQSTYLFEDLFKDKCDFIIGSRREKNSKVLKKGLRNYRGKLFIYFWKKILKDISFVNDTQCAFKAFKIKNAEKLIEDNIDTEFTFDIELILKARLNNLKICKKGIVWIDSDKESNTKDSNIYLDMLKNIINIAEHYKIKLDEESKEHISFLKRLDKNDWKKLIKNIPQEIKKEEVDKFSELNILDKIKEIIKK